MFRVSYYLVHWSFHLSLGPQNVVTCVRNKWLIFGRNDYISDEVTKCCGRVSLL